MANIYLLLYLKLRTINLPNLFRSQIKRLYFINDIINIIKINKKYNFMKEIKKSLLNESN